MFATNGYSLNRRLAALLIAAATMAWSLGSTADATERVPPESTPVDERELSAIDRVPGVAHPWIWRPAPEGQGHVSFSGIFQTLFVYQNDSDFDRTRPYYDPGGQHVGIMGSFFKPVVTVRPLAGIANAPELEVVWDSEFGLSLWSVHDPDQYDLGHPNSLRFSQRQLYARGRMWGGLLGFQVGYQYFTDPTAMFLGHWIGAARLWTETSWGRLEIMGGQLPDQTFEGLVLDSQEKFTRDAFVYGGLAELTPSDHYKLTLGLHGLHDAQLVGRPLDLLTTTLTASCDRGFMRWGLQGAFQWGRQKHGAQGGDEETLAWALQAYATVLIPGTPVLIDLNQLVLSPDDTHDRNNHNGAFFYSSKSRSRTLMLSEDEIRDRGRNYDQRMGERRQNFYLLRGGLSLTDLTVLVQVTDYFVPSVTFGTAFSLEKANTGGSSFAGFETNLHLRFLYRDRLELHLAGVALLPGRALSTFINLYDRTATEPQFMLESSLFVYF